MLLNDWLRLIAGIFVLISLILGLLHSSYWFILTIFVALNLIQSAFTKWCPMVPVLKKLGVIEIVCWKNYDHSR
jgi:hypothetical protein